MIPSLGLLQTIRELYPRCANCGQPISEKALWRDLYIVVGRNRLAHRDCLAAEAEEPSDAAD